MTSINLLPWREMRRKERQRQFASVALGAVVLMAAIILYAHMHVNGLISYQEARNSFLQIEIDGLDKKIKEIKELEAERSALLARMNVIQQLQSQRPRIVNLFDGLVRLLPEGVYLKNLKSKGTLITMQGVAQSNARVSAVMRNVDASPWLDKPQLDVIKSSGKGDKRGSRFTLRATQTDKARKDKEEQG